MTRTLILLLTGGLAGSGSTLLYLENAEHARPARVAMSTVDPQSAGPDGAAAIEFESGRVEAYERAALATTPVELEAMITAEAAAPRSWERELRLEAFILRLTELDPSRMARLGEALMLEARLLAPVYRDWGRSDPQDALLALGTIAPPARQQTFALAILEGLGNERDNVARVADALPAAARFGFELEAVLASAKSDPAAALTAAIAGRGSRFKQLLMPELAAELVELDPFTALAQSSLISNELEREAYTREVYGAWAERAPETLFAYLESSEPPEVLGDYSLVNAVARAAPERMLELADSVPESMAYDIRFAGLSALADRDAAAALARLQSMGAAYAQSALAGAIARSYGAQNPVAAANWAWSIEPPSQAVREEVIQGIATVDYNHAVDLLLADLEQNPRGFGPMGSWLTTLVTPRNANPGYLLDRLLATGAGDSPSLGMVDSVASLWSKVDPAAALSWAVTKGDLLDRAVLTDLARNLSARNPEAAALALLQLSPEQREGWITGVATGLAQSDPDDAVAFLATHRGQPGYEAGMGAVVRVLAEVDPGRAGRLLADANVAVPREAAAQLAASWWIRDADAVTRWMLNLSDERMRNGAVIGIVMAQSERDPDAGRRWLLDLPPGAARDGGLSALLIRSAAQGPLDPRLLEAYSSDIARQEGVSRVVLLTARRNPDEARRLLETHVIDTDLRLAIEAMLAEPGGPTVDPRALRFGEPIR